MPRLWILSDLHQELIAARPARLPAPECDAVIMAGDIDRAPLAIATARALIGPDLPLIIIAGNYEPYGGRMSLTLRVMAAHHPQAKGRAPHVCPWALSR